MPWEDSRSVITRVQLQGDLMSWAELGEVSEHYTLFNTRARIFGLGISARQGVSARQANPVGGSAKLEAVDHSIPPHLDHKSRYTRRGRLLVDAQIGRLEATMEPPHHRGV